MPDHHRAFRAQAAVLLELLNPPGHLIPGSLNACCAIIAPVIESIIELTMKRTIEPVVEPAAAICKAPGNFSCQAMATGAKRSGELP